MSKATVKRLGLSPGWVVVGAAFFLMFGVWNANSSFGVFLPVLSHEFGWSRGAISIAAALNYVLGGFVAFAFGAACDRYGPGRPLAVGAFLAGVAYLLATQTNSLWHFYLLMGLLVGIGMAGMYLVPTTTVARWFVEQRGLALGIVLAGLSLAYVTGPPLAAFLIGSIGWRTTYLLIGLLVWLVVAPAALFMKNPPPGGVSPVVEDSATADAVASTRRAAGAGGAHAPAAGPGAAEGMTFREALSNRRLWILVVSWFCQGFTHIMIAVHVVAYFGDLGVPLATASLALTGYGVSAFVGRLILGHAADRLGTRPIFWLSGSLMILGILVLISAPNLWLVYALVMVFGMGSAGSDTCVVKSVAEVFGTRAVGAIMGVMSLGWRCGAAAGPAVAGYIFDARDSYMLAFGLGAVALVVSLSFFTLATRRVAAVAGPVRSLR